MQLTQDTIEKNIEKNIAILKTIVNSLGLNAENTDILLRVLIIFIRLYSIELVMEMDTAKALEDNNLIDKLSTEN